MVQSLHPSESPLLSNVNTSQSNQSSLSTPITLCDVTSSSSIHYTLTKLLSLRSCPARLPRLVRRHLFYLHLLKRSKQQYESGFVQRRVTTSSPLPSTLTISSCCNHYLLVRLSQPSPPVPIEAVEESECKKS
jgi:hypothetical protein